MVEQDDATTRLEKQMEAADVPESDREEVRRFADFLALRKAILENSCKPIPKEWRGYIDGVDPTKGLPAPVYRYVLVHETDGILLGTSLGMAFWSKLDPVGQSEAVCFESEDAALRYAAGTLRVLAKAVPLQTENKRYATEAECIAAGLPGWS